ncbi:Polycystin cation channel [Novymonas esmeraldas]|uniref:Polycystin cation channel n=1 Tax=Novymonas esmeraldas TaxID=1808958 RepID=A0AAW0F4K7_9TRYP
MPVAVAPATQSDVTAAGTPRETSRRRGPQPAHAAAAYRLHYSFVDAQLLAKADALDRLGHLVFHLVFLIGFCVYFLRDADVSACAQLRHSLLDTLAHTPRSPMKTVSYFSDVSSAQEYGEYVVNVVAPLMANVLYPTGSSLPLGTMRLRTQRSGSSVGCVSGVATEDLVRMYHSIGCANSSFSAAQEDTGSSNTLYSRESRWRYRSCHELGGSRWISLQGHLRDYHCGGFFFDVPLWLTRAVDTAADPAPSLGTREQAFPFTAGTLPYERAALQVMQERHLRPLLWEGSAPFLDNDATRFAVTELLFYSPPLHRVSAVKLVGEVTSGGSWRTMGHFATARVWTIDDVGRGTYDTAVMALGLVWICAYVVEAGRQVRARALVLAHRPGNHACGSGVEVGCLTPHTMWLAVPTAVLEFFSRGWSLLTLGIVCLLAVSGGLRVAAVVHSVRRVPTLDGLFGQQSYPMELEYLFVLDRAQLYLNAVATILLFYRTLYYVSLESHAARLMAVLARVRSALVGYLLVLLILITVFALTLSATYGNTVWAFRSVDASVNTLLRVLVRQQNMGALTRDLADPTPLAFALSVFELVSGLALVGLCAGMVVHACAAVRTAEPASMAAAYQMRWVGRRAWQCLLHPLAWPRSVQRWCAGYGDAAVLRHAAYTLRRYRAARFPALDHVDELLGHLLCWSEFEEAMTFPTNDTVAEDCGVIAQGTVLKLSRESDCASASDATTSTESSGVALEALERRRCAVRERWSAYTAEEVWHDVVEDWLATTTSAASHAFRDEHARLRDGVQAAVGSPLALVKDFPKRLAELERKLALLEGLLLDNDLTSATSVAADRVAREEWDDTAQSG